MGILSWIADRVERKRRQQEGDNYTNIVAEAREYNASLNAMGLPANTEEGMKLRQIGHWEIAKKKFDFLKNYQQDHFIKQADATTKKVIEDKSKHK